MISIVYTPDLNYWRWVLRVSYDGLITIFRTIGLTLIAIAGIGLAVPFTVWPVAVAGVCALAAPEVIISASARRISRMGSAERQIELSPDGVEVTAQDMRCFHGGARITGVVESKQGWAVMVDAQPCVFIPRRALTDEQAQTIAGYKANRHMPEDTPC